MSQMIPVVLPSAITEVLTQSERGNTLLLDDCNMLFVAQTTETQWFFVQYLPDNYPGIHTFFVEGTEVEIRQRVQTDWPGYYCRKNNLGLAVDSNDQLIPIEDEM